ncbi:hypothetical protein NDU88_000638 [Pleurodeles waltl]|uniref:Uncharacterized protein n=1 Tax=Pleurodeles waltl TaxID=8319 RepID=A0AAV7P5J1_PLEWA|nr:hypothetical protein NDU88_000638 [Pleurodeles waltl]
MALMEESPEIGMAWAAVGLAVSSPRQHWFDAGNDNGLIIKRRHWQVLDGMELGSASSGNASGSRKNTGKKTGEIPHDIETREKGDRKQELEREAGNGWERRSGARVWLGGRQTPREANHANETTTRKMTQWIEERHKV